MRILIIASILLAGYCVVVISQSDVVQCAICTILLQSVSQNINQNTGNITSAANTTQITDNLKNTCKNIPALLGGQSVCNQYLQQNLDQITGALNDGVKPSDVCAQIGSCPKPSY